MNKQTFYTNFESLFLPDMDLFEEIRTALNPRQLVKLYENETSILFKTTSE